MTSRDKKNEPPHVDADCMVKTWAVDIDGTSSLSKASQDASDGFVPRARCGPRMHSPSGRKRRGTIFVAQPCWPREHAAVTSGNIAEPASGSRGLNTRC